MLIAVTGGSGKLGRRAVAAVTAGGHRAVNLDRSPPAAATAAYHQVDITDFGQVMGALSGVDPYRRRPDAVLHLAGIPAPGLTPDEVAFRVNTTSTYNVFSACARLGIDNVVWASSETVLGVPFAEPPAFAPVDESHPLRPAWSYALAKVLGETMAGEFVRWRPSMSIASLRFSNILDDSDYAEAVAWARDPRLRRWNLWSHVHVEDAADACQLALETKLTGHEAFIIAGPDSVMPQPSAELMRNAFPSTPLRPGLAERGSLLSSARAATLLGYRPRRSAIANGSC